MGKTIYLNEEQFVKLFGESNDNQSTTIALPDGNNKNVANSINKAKQNTPTADNVMVDTSDFDSNTNNDQVKIDVQAKNGQDASNKINKMMSTNPQLKSLSSKGKLTANVHMEGKQYKTFTKQQIEEQRLKYLRENSTILTKEQIQNYLMTEGIN